VPRSGGGSAGTRVSWPSLSVRLGLCGGGCVGVVLGGLGLLQSWACFCAFVASLGSDNIGEPIN